MNNCEHNGDNDNNELSPAPNKPTPPKKRPPLMLWLITLLILAIFFVIIFGLIKSYHPTTPAPTPEQTNTKPTGLISKVKNKIHQKPAITLQGRVEAQTINVSTQTTKPSLRDLCQRRANS